MTESEGIHQLVVAVRAAYLDIAERLPEHARHRLVRAALQALVDLVPPVPFAVPRVVADEPEPRPAPHPLPDGVERDIAGILDEPPGAGETIELGFCRKEQRLGCVFARLAPIDARALHRRFTDPSDGDTLAAAFGRLTAERRDRLLRFLAGARRRDAIRGAR